MKVILKAFGIMKSKILEWPENQSGLIELLLTTPISHLDYKKSVDHLPLKTLCVFEFTGQYRELPSGEFARTYVLRDVVKK